MDFSRHSGLIEEQGGPWSGPFGKHCIPAPPPPTPHTHTCFHIATFQEFLKWQDWHPGFTKFTPSSKVSWVHAIQRQYAIWEHIDLPRFGLPMPLSDPYPMLPPGTSLVAQMLRGVPVTRETSVQSLGWEDPMEKQMATHSSTLAWKIQWMEEPGQLQSTESQRIRHDWITSLHPMLLTAKSLQSCPSLCDPIPGILQARTHPMLVLC